MLADFMVEYNDHPHQGIENISPNKLASHPTLFNIILITTVFDDF